MKTVTASTRSLVRIVYIAIGIVVVITGYYFLLQPIDSLISHAHILLQTDQALLGSTIYVDNKRVLIINRKTDMLSLSTGTHTIEARHVRYGQTKMQYHVIDDEQGSRESLLLRQKNGKMEFVIK